MSEPEKRDEDVFDPLPAFLAELDQALKLAPHAARVAWTQYQAYVAEGFTAKQAIYLVAAFLRAPEAPDA